MIDSAYLDTFARDNLPPRGQWPQLLFERPELQFPDRLNAAAAIVDGAIARGWGSRVAIVGESVRWTYDDLLDRANRIAHVLTRQMGLIPGNRVLLRAPNNPLLAAAWFGVIKAGGIVVGTMPLLRAKELSDIIVKARITHALCDARLTDELYATRAAATTLREICLLGGDAADSLDARMVGMSDEFTAVDTAADDVCIIAFTSGTTGTPKGTMHFHRDMIAMCECFPRFTIRASANDVFCGTPPLAFTFGLGGLLFFPLHIGAAAVLLEKLLPDSLLQAIADFRVSVVFTAPTFYRQMTPLVSRYDLSSLKKCISAGEALPDATRQLWKNATGIEMIDGIGATEMLHVFIAAAGDEVRRGATGKVVPGYRACVLDDQGTPVPPGTVGHLAVKGPTGCRYLADERQTKYVQNGWNLTGDAYAMDADGYFFYHARTDDMIISAGYNIAGPEVEGTLLLHPAVAECGVVGQPDAERGAIVAAFVVLKPEHQGDAAMTQSLQQFVKREIAPYKYPRAIYYLPSLPRTETGKLQRFRLRDMSRVAHRPISAKENP